MTTNTKTLTDKDHEISSTDLNVNNYHIKHYLSIFKILILYPKLFSNFRFFVFMFIGILK